MRARAVVVLFAIAAASCGRPCRGIETKALAVECEEGATFTGEIHLDDSATYESFLEIECIPNADEAVVQELVSQVDFLNDVVFVATGFRGVAQRCIEEREVGAVEVCDDGLRVAFDDNVSDRQPCGGRWSVAFALPRDEMRAALGGF